MGKYFWMWIVHSSELWITVNCEKWQTVLWNSVHNKLNCSSDLVIKWVQRFKENWNTYLYHSKTLLVKQGTFLYEAWPDLVGKRDILNTGNMDISGIGYWKSYLIGELFITSESRTLNFSNSDIFVHGRNKERRVSKLEINWIVSWSVIYLSGRTQGSAFWADLPRVSLLMENFGFLWWIVIIIGIN